MKTLKNVLLINALSSGATGIGLVAMPGLFATLFDTPLHMPFVATGIFLTAFAAVVFIESRKDVVSAPWLRLIIVLDTTWVLASAIIVAFHVFEISTLGYVMIGAVALWVALMAYLQYAGLRKNFAAS